MRVIPKATKQVMNIFAHEVGLKYEFSTRKKIMMELQNLIDNGATNEELNNQLKTIIEATLKASNESG